MLTLKKIIGAINNDRIRITDHADEEARSDSLSFDEIILSVMNGEIIEEYLKDKPFPSCLVYVKNFMNQPIHSVWGYNEKNQWAVLITVYRPDPQRWMDWKIRMKKDDSI